MLRFNLALVAVALAAAASGCAQCGTCDDFPVPCSGGSCAGGPPVYPPVAGTYTIAEPGVVMPPAMPPGVPMPPGAPLPPGVPAAEPLPAPPAGANRTMVPPFSSTTVSPPPPTAVGSGPKPIFSNSSKPIL